MCKLFMAATVTRKEFDALVKRVELLEMKFSTLDSSINIIDQRVDLIDKVFKDIEAKHDNMTNGPTIGDVDYTADIIADTI